MAETKENGDIDFKWGRKKGVGLKNKDVQFYESFHFDGVEYNLYDCVYLYKESEPEPYIGKIIKIWEHPNKLRKVKVLWFFRPCEIVNHLGIEELCENELLLASGEGVGLTNVNPLEAIAGKCHILCVSKDTRNLQPSYEELQMADFVFSRTFDVAQCKIMDKIDDIIAGTEVKFIFNRVGSLNGNDVDNIVYFDKEDKGLGQVTLEGKKNGKEGEPYSSANKIGHTCRDHSFKVKSPCDLTTPTFDVDPKHMSKLDNNSDNVVKLKTIVKPLGDINRPLKKRKVDASKMLSDKHKIGEGKSTNEFGLRHQALVQSGSASVNQLEHKYLNESSRGESGLMPKPEQKSMELSGGKLHEISSHQSPRNDNKGNYKALQAPLPIDVDKNSWFKEPDIIWQGFNEKCSARMLLQTTAFSPHYGQAFVIFKTKEAAYRAIKRLDTGCLVQPNGRPLVGCLKTPCSPGKQSTFYGHLLISNPKQPPTRETKEAVSTSHCSQPNTIAYDMATEWCLLQQRSDFVLDKLYEQQEMGLRKVKAQLKSKQSTAQ